MNCFEFNRLEVNHLSHLSNELVAFLHRGNELFDHLVKSAADKWQLSTPEMRILLFLDQHPEMDTARDVAVQCAMSKASVSGNVLKLATRGLLTVDVDLKDRRFQHLTITDLAAPILEDARKRFQSVDHDLIGILTDEEQQQFLALLKKLNDDQRFQISSDTGKD